MSAAADEMDDLDFVAILDHHLTQRGARHDRQIALDRDLFGREAEIGCKVGQAHARANAAVLAIDLDREGSVGVQMLTFPARSPLPFASSEVEKPVRAACVSTSLDTSG